MNRSLQLAAAVMAINQGVLGADSDTSAAGIVCKKGEWCLQDVYKLPVSCSEAIKFICPDGYKPVNETELPEWKDYEAIGCKKFGTYEPFVEVAKSKSTPDYDLKFWGGGKQDMTCPSTNIQRAQWLTNVCYCRITWQYDLWWWMHFIGYWGVLGWTSFAFYAMREGEKDKKIPVNPQFIAIFMNFTACIVRIVWMINNFNGRGNPQVFDEVTNSFLVKIGQVLMLSEFLLIVLVWKAVVDSTQKMKAVSKADQLAQDRKKFMWTCVCIFFMLFTICPFDIGGVLGNPLMALISNAIMLLITVFLVGGGFVYSRTLAKLLSGGDAAKMDKKKKDAVAAILHAVYFSTFLAVICVIAVGVNTVLAGKGPEYLIWGWWLPIHACEVCLLFTLATSTSQKARAAMKVGKKADAYFSKGTSTHGSEREKTSEKEVSLVEKGAVKRPSTAANPAKT
jgi:hypothetical protein